MVRWQAVVNSAANPWCVEVYGEDGLTYDAQGNPVLDVEGNYVLNGLPRPTLRVRYFNASTIVRHIRITEGNKTDTYDLSITGSSAWVEFPVPQGRQADLNNTMISAW